VITNKRLVRIDDTRAMELTTYEPDSVVEPAYPAFDTPQPSEAERIAALEARVEVLEAGAVTMRNGETWQLIRLTRCPHCEQDTRDRYYVTSEPGTGRLVCMFDRVYCADCGQVKR